MKHTAIGKRDVCDDVLAREHFLHGELGHRRVCIGNEIQAGRAAPTAFDLPTSHKRLGTHTAAILGAHNFKQTRTP